MAKDRLYLLKPGFQLDDMSQFCADCATVEGMLGFFPALRDAIDVHYVDFQRPRPRIVAELGPDNQSSPCLVVADPATARSKAPHAAFKSALGKHFLDEPLEICDYLARAHGTPRPHA